ncbi:MAG TPA: hypothetical protein DEX10_02630 [Betaproteobacteria bacterium]|nr:hypothetical protein [Betaproteobacteria bacterium]
MICFNPKLVAIVVAMRPALYLCVRADFDVHPSTLQKELGPLVVHFHKIEHGIAVDSNHRCAKANLCPTLSIRPNRVLTRHRIVESRRTPALIPIREK